MEIDYKSVLQGLKKCSLDKDVSPNCKECPYSFNGQKCENNRTGKRCCDELKDDLMSLLHFWRDHCGLRFICFRRNENGQS